MSVLRLSGFIALLILPFLVHGWAAAVFYGLIVPGPDDGKVLYLVRIPSWLSLAGAFLLWRPVRAKTGHWERWSLIIPAILGLFTLIY